MLNFVPLEVQPEQGTPISALPPFTESLTWVQRHPRAVVVAGLTLTVASGVSGLVLALGGAL